MLPLAVAQTASSAEPPRVSGIASRPEAVLDGRRRSFLPGVGWGITWRYGMLGAVTWDAGTRSGSRPWMLLLAIVAGGVALGLYRRRWVIARVWRTFVVAITAVYAGPMFAVYPDVLIGSLGVLTLSPFVATWRRRNA